VAGHVAGIERGDFSAPERKAYGLFLPCDLPKFAKQGRVDACKCELTSGVNSYPSMRAGMQVIHCECGKLHFAVCRFSVVSWITCGFNTFCCLGFLLFILALSVHGQGTNEAVAMSGPAGQARAGAPELATAYEKTGRKREAALIYEDMARTNTAARKVLSHRLVTLYTEMRKTNQALTWAREVMLENPDPPAYLAAVHARLGQHKEAQKILEREIATNTNATRAVVLRWQLADVSEAEGDKEKTEKILTEAAAAAKGSPMEATAQKRLKATK